jgi:hypothetical protein
MYFVGLTFIIREDFYSTINPRLEVEVLIYYVFESTVEYMNMKLKAKEANLD